ncbi:MAG: FAD/NAD(P)-binding protein [Candidatus Promineifilaceae bacterium]|nr:FAD/NAD(P)-binding protein [Candidatus Promineifilaceae bacterium]
MTLKIPHHDINLEPFMSRPPDFNRKHELIQTERSFRAQVVAVIPLTDQEKLFHIRICDRIERESFSFLPGQFVMLEVPGCGEVAISISSSTSNQEFLELCIRKVGKVTGMLHRLEAGAFVGIRGPFGTHFPMGEMIGSNVLLIAGGLGIAPLRSPIFWVNEHRRDYKDVTVLYGTKDPSQILFDYQTDEWQRIYGLQMLTIVEQPDESWNGPVGLITELFEHVPINPEETFAIVCGPPVMFKFVCSYLSNLGLPRQRMFVSLERRMHCGMGKCCRCNVGSTFTCLDGPVFDYWTVMNLKEAI